LALAAQNRKGDIYPAGDGYPGNIIWVTPDVLASFALIGNGLGILLCLWVIILGGIDDWPRRNIIAWTILSGVMLWFLCGAVGMWCFVVELNQYGHVQLFYVEFGIEVVSSVIYLILLCLVVSRLRTREVPAK
jgi:hypothetical protein